MVWSSQAISRGAKMAQDAIWDASGAPFGGLVGRIMAPGWAKMPLCWPTWRQDMPKMANLEPKIGNLGRFWKHLGDFFGILGAVRAKLSKTKKNNDSGAVLEVFKRSWR